MSIAHNKLRLHIDVAAIAGNYNLLAAKGGSLIPVIKADAYGHGLYPVAWTLSRAGAQSLAVGTVEEAALLRELPFTGRIVSLLGPIDAEEYRIAAERDILPVLHDPAQFAPLEREAARLGRAVPVALKCDSGMGRLGFHRKDTDKIVAALARHPGLAPVMLCSHLATADDASDDSYVTAQIEVFKSVYAKLNAAGFVVEANLANSAALLSRPDTLFDACRPGISLYGANPFFGTRKAHLGRGLTPAMSAFAPIIAVHDLAAGAGISYGLTFTAEADMRVAVVAAGYADAYSRHAGNRAQMLVRGKRAPVIGRVCMQMTAIDVSGIAEARPGDAAWLLGGEGGNSILPEELADWWGSIPYEVFCMLGVNKREYV